MSAPRLSVIIPTVNEARTLPALLGQLRAQRGVELEILVADGNSSDGTQIIATELGARVITVLQRGRGAQMNQAASLARGEMLLFLHADSGLPHAELLKNGLARFDAARARLTENPRRRTPRSGGDGELPPSIRWEERLAGHFTIHFVDPPFRPPRILAWFEAKSALDRPECIFGDRGMLISKRFFDALGGFAEERPFLEDVDFAARVARNGLWITLPGQIETSARRFRKEGYVKRALLNGLILAAWHAEFSTFLAAAPALYRSQDTTAPLRLLPFLRLIRQHDGQENSWIVWRRWYRMTRFMRRSLLWQGFYLVDLLATPLRPPGIHPLLLLNDRLLSPLLDLTPLDLLLTPLVRGLVRMFTWMDKTR
ncbi:MAG: glycosyltransferase [Magnetococcales bacterium]|nr:glycosyltransferase [Magnetococcales bacterium]